MGHYIWICILLCLFSCTILSGQWGWSEGYVITNSQDTLYGKIQKATPAIRSVNCVFKQEGYSQRVKYLPFTIKGFMVDGSYYVSRVYDVHPSYSYGLGVFMEMVNLGGHRVKLLRHWNTDGWNGYTQYFLVKPGDKAVEVPLVKWKAIVANYFADDARLSSSILSGYYKRRELLEIVNAYNENQK